MLRNEQLWGELERKGITWEDLQSNIWGDFKILSSTIQTTAEMQAQGVNIELNKTTIEGITQLNVQGINIETSPTIIDNTAEITVSCEVSTIDFKGNLLNYIPKYYRKSELINNLLDAIVTEFRKMDFEYVDAEDNLFINTTKSQINRWEEELGIVINKTKPLDFRREKILSKLRSIGIVTTKKSIEIIASSYSSGEVEVIEDNENYKFTIKFISIKGIPPNMEDLAEIIEQIKPAHLALNYHYIYNTWRFLENKTWQDISSYTWEDIQTFN